MRIGIDATSLCRQATGIEIYTRNLIKELLKRPRRLEYVVFFRKEVHPELRSMMSAAEFHVCPRPEQLYCDQVWLPRTVRRAGCDLVHYPAFPPGALTSVKYAITLHDAVLWRFPAMCSWKGRWYFRPMAARAAKRAARILTVSESSRRDIVRFLGVDPGRIVNAGESCNPIFRPEADAAESVRVRALFGLPSRFILSVSTFEPRKNIFRLLEAWRRLRGEPAVTGHSLVLVGRRGWGTNPLMDAIRSLDLERDVIVTGHVCLGDLVILYNLAEAFVYPSLYEGFGLPVLEAMACGTPVLCADASALPEVVGEAALTFDPRDVEALARNLIRMMEDDSLRRRLREAGLHRAATFSWDAVACRIERTYEAIGEESL